jgi:RNA polymerase sigma factor (sigma-70 family)
MPIKCPHCATSLDIPEEPSVHFVCPSCGRTVWPDQELGMSGGEPQKRPPGQFPTTHWSHVAQAGDLESPGTREALESLCTGYWYPLFAFIRSRGHGADEARDLVQEYFARLLEGRVLAAADPAKGRFRTFLIADCIRFLSHQRARALALKRGGNRRFLTIDRATAEQRYAFEPSSELTPEQIYDRAWTVTLLDEVLTKLRAEYQRDGRDAVFERLKEVLTAEQNSVPYATIAAELGVTEGAVQVAVHRLRRRYGAFLRREIAATLSDPSEVEDEIRALFAALET